MGSHRSVNTGGLLGPQGASPLNMNPPKPVQPAEGVPRQVGAAWHFHAPPRLVLHCAALEVAIRTPAASTLHLPAQCTRNGNSQSIWLDPDLATGQAWQQRRVSSQVVYMPACVTRMMGPARGDTETASVHEKLLSLFEKAGYEVIYPEVPPAALPARSATGALHGRYSNHCRARSSHTAFARAMLLLVGTFNTSHPPISSMRCALSTRAGPEQLMLRHDVQLARLQGGSRREGSPAGGVAPQSQPGAAALQCL